jgi:hypothetical protein
MNSDMIQGVGKLREKGKKISRHEACKEHLLWVFLRHLHFCSYKEKKQGRKVKMD